MAVASVLHRAMALKRDQRPATARAMREALREAGGASATGRAGASIAMGSPPPPPTAAAGYGQTLPATADSGLIAPAPTYPAAHHPGATNAPALFATQQTAVQPARTRTLLMVLIGVIVVALGVAAFVLMNRNARSRRLEMVTPAPPPPTNPSPSNSPGGNVSGVPGGLPGGAPTGGVAPPPAPPSEKKEESQPKETHKAGGALQASATRRVEPAYPQLAKAARVSGTVVVEVMVNEQGNVVDAHALSGHPLLQQAAVQAARGWKFAPTRINGEPVKVVGTITFNFQM
jgi:TonB family protein